MTKLEVVESGDLNHVRLAEVRLLLEADGKLVRTPDDDDSLMVLRFGSTASLDLRSPISCEGRTGDAW